MNKNGNATLRLPALEIRQGPRRTLYTFAVDGKELANFATISRIGRTEEHTIKGYQRPEVLSHIADIQQYLESSNPMIPNAIVVAFNRSVEFEPSAKNGNRITYSRPGELVIPIRPDEPDEKRPDWIVDGQQRMAAICSAKIKSFPICVVGFIAGDDAEQREQFINVLDRRLLGVWPGCSTEVERDPEYPEARSDAGELPARAIQGAGLESYGRKGERMSELPSPPAPLPEYRARGGMRHERTALTPCPSPRDHEYMVPGRGELSEVRGHAGGEIQNPNVEIRNKSEMPMIET